MHDAIAQAKRIVRMIVVFRDGKHPTPSGIGQIGQSILRQCIRAFRIQLRQSETHVTRPAALLLLDLQQEDLTRLQRLLGKGERIREARPATGDRVVVRQRNVGAMVRMEAGERAAGRQRGAGARLVHFGVVYE